MAAGISALALVAVILGALGWAVFHLAWARNTAAAALLLYVALEAWRTPRSGQFMLLAAVAATVAALLRLPDASAVLSRALAEAVFITGLFTSLGMLRDTAQGSALVRDCGEAMVRQPPGRRYAVLSLGSHVISLALNFGVLALLGVMVMRGNTLEAAEGDAKIRDIRKRRMMTAVLRGFAMMTVWSPLSVSFAVTQGAMHGVAWERLLAIQLILAALLMGLGWVMDRRAHPPGIRRFADTSSAADARPLLLLSLLIGAIVVAAVSVAAWLSVRMVIGTMLVVPLAALAWLAVQQRAPLAAARDFTHRLSRSLPAFRYEVAMLGGAMYVGTVVAGFISPAAAAAAIGGLPLPPIVLVIAMAWSVMLLAQIGISQIITVSLLGSALADLSQLGIHPLVAASGLMGAWGLSACSTLVGAAVLSVARIAEVPAATVARDWNGRFVLAGAVVLAVWMLTLSLVLR
ncbi:hypothetical protein A6A04_14170 [Paramagnetospirillum marisnigri]|uniref:Uncharacterized protein n=1 Tax=Paramagnetospirillum marisnigri TaxID=1285242 RepID=A0A178MUK9_9PROT|nr:hypothetical protein A6A04_14170 [Paramagnetospirillum marisnigri]